MTQEAHTVRTRYAPSPTGQQHIGGLRTALYNYLFARIHGGTFVLRIEDTDRTRFQHDAVESILDSLRWIGIAPDESPERGGDFAPYVQSERLALYRQYAEELVAKGHAYWAYDTDEELLALKQRGEGYDGRGRWRSDTENRTRRTQGVSGVVRFVTPSDGEAVWRDMVLERQSCKHANIARDPVLLKRDGYPTYHLASVVDDHLMRITHVLRAQEWLSSTPLHLLLYQAFGWTAPMYGHLPLIVGTDGKKLSKRHGAIAVHTFREQGILPAALCNYIALLGWSYDDSRERFSLSELERLFAVERVQKSAATFDWQKLRWHNSYYLQQMGDIALLNEICAALESKDSAEDTGNANGEQAPTPKTNSADEQEIQRAHDIQLAHDIGKALQQLTVTEQDAAILLAQALKQRIKITQEAYPYLQYLSTTLPSPTSTLLCGKKLTATEAVGILRQVNSFGDSALKEYTAYETQLQQYCTEHDLPFGHSVGVVRAALSSAQSSLSAQVMLATLPLSVIRTRINRAIGVLSDG